MDAFMKKLRLKQDHIDDKISDIEDPSELALADDEPYLSSGFSGTLTFAGGDSESAKDIKVSDAGMTSYPVAYSGSQSRVCRVTFEVTSADVIKETRSSSVLPRGHSSHVDYTITVTSNAGMKSISTGVVRRYSDFEQLHKALKKRFSNLVAGKIVFPQKVFVGNFSSETIAKRSRAFETYLTHLYSVLDLRYSREFTQFFTGEDYPEAMRFLLEGKHFLAIPPLERYLTVLEKLYANSHKHLTPVVCALVVSHARTNRPNVAEAYATLALGSLPLDSSSSSSMPPLLLLPLLQKLLRLRWSLGFDREDVEARLAGLKEAGVDVDPPQDLEEELCKWLRSKSH